MNVYFDNQILPEIPAELQAKGPYFLLKSNMSGVLQMWACSSKMWFDPTKENPAINQNAGTVSYMRYNQETNAWENLSSGNWYSEFSEMFWANYDVPSGSESSSTIYKSKGNEPAEFGGYTCGETSSGTTLMQGIKVYTGWWVLATVVVRSRFTAPEGWTVLHESDPLADGTQRQIILCQKAAHDGVININAVQETAGRIYINLLAFADINGFVYHEGHELIDSTTAETTFVRQRPAYEKIVWCMNSYYWDTSSTHALWTCDTLPAGIQLPNTTQPRLANFYDAAPSAESRTFVAGTATTAGRIFDLVEVLTHTILYPPEGSAVFAVTEIQQITSFSDAQLSWLEETPENTAVNVYAKVDDGEYARCTNGAAPPCLEQGEDYSESTLYIKAVLTTDDPSATPSISGIRLVIHDVTDANVIVLHFGTGNLTSIQNAAGDITVAYAGGTLMGRGGPVLAFSETFTPEELIFKGHQNDTEHIEVNLSVSSELKHVEYINTRELEHIEVDISVEGQLINIKDI